MSNRLIWVLFFAAPALYRIPIAAQVPPGLDRSEIGKAALRMDALVKCGERVWRSADWREIQVVFVDPTQHMALLWNDQRSRAGGANQPLITAVNAAEFGSPPPGHFTSVVYRGARTMLVWWAGSAEDLVDLAIHEGFHLFHQHGMPSPIRGEYYPEDWEARYLRFELLRALATAFDTQKPADLRRAAFWWTRLRIDHARSLESTDGIDLTEGTASFVGKLGVALTEGGCDTQTAPLLRRARQLLKLQPLPIDKDHEAYQLGLITGLLLEQRAVARWQEQAIGGRSLLELLLQDVAPEPAGETDRRVAREFQTFYERKNQDKKSIIDRFLQDASGAEFFNLAIPERMLSGSFRADGFLSFDHPILKVPTTLVLNLHAQYATTTGTLELQRINVIRSSRPVADGFIGSYVYFPLPRSAFHRNDDGTFRIADPRVRTPNLRVRETMVPGLAPWMIVQ
jgi:hypothetical protein